MADEGYSRKVSCWSLISTILLFHLYIVWWKKICLLLYLGTLKNKKNELLSKLVISKPQGSTIVISKPKGSTVVIFKLAE